MELTKKQQEGLEIALNRYRNGEHYTVISGYAGTGKSTLVKFIIAALAQDGIDPDTDVVYTSFTGKATQVLQKKGNQNVSTLHRLLYKHYPLPNGGYKRERVDHIDYKIVVVDECSMVPLTLFKDLARHQYLYILCLGDPGQLPPVDSNEDNHLLDTPHIFLDEIMRQAAESEIIQLSMKIRNGESIEYMKGNEVQIIHKSELNTGMLQWADQILVATNNTRHAINMQMRQLLGLEGTPQDGDKMICLRNYWDTFSDCENALVNGTIGYLKDAYTRYVNIAPYKTVENSSRMPILTTYFISDSEETFGALNMDKYLIENGTGILDWKNHYRMSKNKRLISSLPMEFAYGYAITGHKSQGSEWDKVLVIEEKFPFDKEEHKKWLYTCCTRASQKLVLVRPD